MKFEFNLRKRCLDMYVTVQRELPWVTGQLYIWFLYKSC